MKYKTEWDFKNLFYKKGLKDPQIEVDMKAAEKACEDFAKNYSGKDDYLNDENALLKLLDEYEKMYREFMPARPQYYLHLLLAVDSQNQEAQAKMNLFTDRLTKAFNQIIFFEIKLGKISASKQNEFLASKVLHKYKFFLERLFLTAKYILTEAEEKILNIKSTTSRGMWNDYSDKLLNSQNIKWKGKEIPLPEASGMIRSLPKKDRYALHKLLMEKLKEISYFSEAEMTAIVTDKKASDELKGFTKPYESRIIGYQNDVKSIENLVETVTKNFKISQRFYKLHAKVLKEKSLSYADRAVGIKSNAKPLSFDKGVELFNSALEKTDQKFVDLFQGFLKNGQVDVYPKKGKSGGAFCSTTLSNPTFVMLNNVPNTESYFTLAHEMGHAFHSELSKESQPAIYGEYTISAAEVASTFFENIGVEALSTKLTEKEKFEIDYKRVQDSISTVFRQIACFNFEVDIHNEVRTKGSITKERLAELHNINMSKYMGPSVKLNELDGYFFVQWSHIRNHFYVYSYAYGDIISKAMYARYKKDPTFIKSVIKFLSAGGSMTPEDIFKSIGIDTTKPEFFLEGLKEIESEIVRLEKVGKKLGVVK
jgi:oligoendopeptidase F